MPSQIRDKDGNFVEYSNSNYASGKKNLIPLDGKDFSKNNSYYLAQKFEKIERYKNFLKISDGHKGFTFIANEKKSEDIEEKYEKVKAVSLKIIKTIPVFGKAIGTVLEFMNNFSDNVLKNLPKVIKKNGVVAALSKIPGSDKLLDKFKDIADDKKDTIIAKIFEVINTNVLDQIKTWNGVKSEEDMLEEIVKNINNGPIKAYNETVGASKDKIIPNIMTPKQMEEKFTVGYQKLMGGYFGIGDYRQLEPKAQVLYKPKWGSISRLFNKFNPKMREILDEKGGAKVMKLGYNNIANEEYLIKEFVAEKKQDAKDLEERKRKNPFMVIAEIFNKIFRLEKAVKKVSKRANQKIEAQNKKMQEFKTVLDIQKEQIEEQRKEIEILKKGLAKRTRSHNKNVEEVKGKEEEIKELKQQNKDIKKENSKNEEKEKSEQQNKNAKELGEEDEEIDIEELNKRSKASAKIQKQQIQQMQQQSIIRKQRLNADEIRLDIANSTNDLNKGQTQNKSQGQGRGGNG